MSVEELDTAPRMGPLYARVLAAGVRNGDVLPDDELVLRDQPVDRAHLATYARACGFTLRDRLPATYPHVLAFPLAIALMARPSFPFALAGLVHLRQRITQRRALTSDEKLTARVYTEARRPHPKGEQFDVISEVTVEDDDAGADPAWRGVSTYLRRGGVPSGAGGGILDGTGDAVRETSPLSSPPAAIWRVPADVGRRYAAASGDINPIHLSRLTSRLGGFKRPIAHGMWTAARCLAALEPRLGVRLDYEVAFRAPLLLPATVALRTRRRDGVWALQLDAAGKDRTHLTGSLTEM